MRKIDTIKFDGIADLKQQIMRLDTAEERPIEIDGKGSTDKFKAIWNIDKNKLATVATNQYTLVQHKEVYEPFIDILSRLNLDVKGKIENANGAVYLTAWFKDLPLVKDDADGIMKGIRLINSFDHYTAIRGELWGLRLVCSNGMKIPGFETIVRRAHVGAIDTEKLVESFVQRIIHQSESLQQYVSESMAESVEWDILKQVMKKLFVQKRHRDNLMTELEIEYNKKGKLTRWDIYNVVTAYITHGKKKILSLAVQDYLQGKAGKILTQPMEALVSH